jgi:hypothetical protein
VLKLAIAREAAAQSPFLVKRCAPDSVAAGTVCLDKYEASAWRVPSPAAANAQLVRRIQLGVARDDYDPCLDNGQDCADEVYAVSLPAEIPSTRLTWFQAQEACANSRGEWNTRSGSPGALLRGGSFVVSVSPARCA